MKKILTLSLLLLPAIQALPLNYENKILALYKSSENQSEKENEIFFYLSQPLSKMGLSVEYWDIDRGLPTAKVMADIRAVVTWFRGPAMQNPETYLDFLDNTIESGRKVIIIDNFGAYQDRKNNQYLNQARLNLTLAKLGIQYFGDWTDNPDLIDIAYKDSAMVEFQGIQDPTESRLFYRYLQHDHNLRIFLSIRRKDRNYDPSPVIVTNKNGGFAFSRYIYRVEQGKVQLLLNVQSFLKEALFPRPSRENIALLIDDSTVTTKRIFEYTSGVLRRAKLPFEVIHKEQFSRLLSGDLRTFTAVGLILKDDAGLKGAVLEDYMQQGGGVVSLYGGNFRNLSASLALNAALNEPRGASKIKTGYKLRYGFLLGEGLSLEEPTFEWLPGSSSPAKGAEILASSYRGSFPLLWTAERGKGRLLFWNWDGFETGDFQGLLLESFLFVRPVGIAATAGIGIMFIDDWPLPMYNIKRKSYKITDTEFYYRVFWPDIKSFFAERDIPFASFLIFNYSGTTTPPFTGGEFFVAEEQASLKIAREILESPQELALHGFNHMSLTEKKTNMNPNRWPSRSAMKEGLIVARREWINLFGEYSLPFAYVAPNNIISALGMEALKEVFPSIKVVCALRSGMGEETHTEFQAHPAIKDLYLIPRSSSGYPFTREIRQLIVSSISGAGILSHFFHPDDVFDENRSQGMTWQELKKDFARMLDFVKRHYPWLEYVSIRDAEKILREIDAAGTEFQWQENRLTIRSRPGMKLRIRLNQKDLSRQEGVKIIHRYRRPPALVVEMTRPVAQLFFK